MTLTPVLNGIVETLTKNPKVIVGLRNELLDTLDLVQRVKSAGGHVVNLSPKKSIGILDMRSRYGNAQGISLNHYFKGIEAVIEPVLLDLFRFSGEERLPTDYKGIIRNQRGVYVFEHYPEYWHLGKVVKSTP